MLKKIKTQIGFLRSKKYQNITLNKQSLLNRYKTFKYILGFESKKKKFKKCCKNNFFEKNLNKKNFIEFYKKFNSNLVLKQKYNLYNYKKKSNLNTCFCSYIHLLKFIQKSTKINNLHKLNTILKINDLLIFLYNRNKHDHYLDSFKKSLKLEIRMLKKFL